MKILKNKQPQRAPDAYDRELWEKQKAFKDKQRRDQEEMRRQSAAFQMPEAPIDVDQAVVPDAGGSEAGVAQSTPITLPLLQVKVLIQVEVLLKSGPVRQSLHTFRLWPLQDLVASK